MTGANDAPSYALLAGARLPRHVAIIMDGNGRWAQARELPRTEGHQQGTESVRAVIRATRRMNIPFLTLFAFSTENWNRPSQEIQTLMELLSFVLDRELENLLEHDIRLRTIGRTDRLPDTVQERLQRVMDATAGNQSLTLTVALSYSSRDEITRAAAALAREAASGRLDPAEIDEEKLAARLDTAGLPDPDLVIRTSGELRLSNFLLWQSAYAELYITDVFWPDFREQEYLEALHDYSRRERRFGKTSDQMTPQTS